MKHSALALITRHGQLWAIDPRYAGPAMAALENVDLHVHLKGFREGRAAEAPAKVAGGNGKGNDKPFRFTSNGVAVFRVSGPMTKESSSWDDGCSMAQVGREVRAARMDPDVIRGTMNFDTPGGSISGLTDFHAEIDAFNRAKGMDAFVQDLCCSAGYWAASACRAVYANSVTADVGSLGVRMVARDYSGMFKKAGVIVYPVDTGEFKSAGEPGTKITPKMLAEWQRLVDQTGDEFIAAIMAGRGMSEDEVRAVFTGQVWNASDALDLGLIDGIASLDAVIAGDVISAKSTRKARAVAASTGGKEDDDMANERVSLWEQLKAKLSGEPAVAAVAGELVGAPLMRIEGSAALLDLNARMAALEAENAALKAANGGAVAAQEAAEAAAASAKSAGMDAWLMEQKRAGFLLPGAEAEAKEIYEALGEAKATAFLTKNGNVAPFAGKTKTANEVGPTSPMEASADDINPYKVIARRREQLSPAARRNGATVFSGAGKAD